MGDTDANGKLSFEEFNNSIKNNMLFGHFQNLNFETDSLK